MTKAEIEALAGRRVPVAADMADWDGVKYRPIDTDGPEASTALRALLAENERYREALDRIACFDDDLANAYLEKHESYASFDEPGSVQIARQALQETDNAG